MTTKLEKGFLKIDLLDCLERLSLEEKKELIDTLSCGDDVIKNVVDQVLDGYTELGSHGSIAFAQATETFGLGWAKREIAKRSGEVAAKQIKALEESLERSQANYYEALVEKRRR